MTYFKTLHKYLLGRMRKTMKKEVRLAGLLAENKLGTSRKTNRSPFYSSNFWQYLIYIDSFINENITP
jgi:hypothetical protein